MPRAAQFVLGLLALLAATLAHAIAPAPPPPQWLVEQVKALSAPEMEGRRSGTPGADRAAEHIVGVFRDAGLRPGGDAGGFLQAFPVATGIRLGSVNRLTRLGAEPLSLTLGQDFVPLAVSANGSEEGEIVFVGYGISAPDLGYDDYAGVNAHGKVVLAMTGEPRAQDPASPFRRPEAYHYAERNHKIINAREHGARAVLLVSRPGAEQALPRLQGISQPWGIVAAQVTHASGDALLAPSGRRLAELGASIDAALAPRSFPLGARVELVVSLVRERGTATNVVAILPGTDPRLRDEAIVIGAHYDHLGRGGEGSLAPDQEGTIHPGADDNASGTTAVMALARAFAAGGRTRRTLVFVAFGGEELGLLGSSHYVHHPAVALERTALMINLDMVGRLRDDKLYVGGADSGAGLRRVMDNAARGLGLKLQLRGDPFAPSDHTVFYSAGRPVLFLFTGAHADYHRPSDTWDKISLPGLTTVISFTARVIAAVAEEPTPPTYVKIERPARGAGSGSGYGPFFGVIPEFGESDQPGVKISGVRPGSPADRAGVRAGDVIVKFAGITVKTLEDLTFALRGHRPGDRVDVVIVRDGEERPVQAVLEERHQ